MNNDQIADFEIRFLQDFLKMIDEKIKYLNGLIDPDDHEESVYFDPIEHLHGIGFVTSQRYISTICNLFEVKKNIALEQGPKKHNIPIAKIVNATANYWKHIEDYNSSLHQSTVNVLEALNVKVEESYCAVNSLYKCEYQNFIELSNGLIEWRNSLLDSILNNNI